MGYSALAGGAFAVGLLALVARRWVPRGRLLLRALREVLALLAASGLIAASYLAWYVGRPLPAPEERLLFEGVSYRRLVRRAPRPVIVHLLTVDLEAPGLEVRVTPPRPTGGRHAAASTTSRFLASEGLQVAINGAFFYPFRANGPFDYYPRLGDPVDNQGFLMARGAAYGALIEKETTLWIAGGRAALGREPHPAEEAISGYPLITAGAIEATFSPEIVPHAAEPRTAVGVRASGTELVVVVADGRQPGYSEGLTLPELAALLLELGATDAVNLDGGGSSTLVIAGEDGRPRVLNTPIHGRHPPGVERPVASHLGFRARRLEAR